MTGLRKFASICGAMGIALLASSAGALADGYEVAAPAAVDEGRKFTYSFNIGGTSDYVFRGVSQTSNEPALQGGADIGWGILYAGVWASRVDFDERAAGQCGGRLVRRHQADVELAIRHHQPRLRRHLLLVSRCRSGICRACGDPNYFELKAGYSWSALHPSLVTGTTVYWSPDYVFETGSVWTIETMAAWTVGKFGPLTPVINGVARLAEGRCERRVLRQLQWHG